MTILEYWVGSLQDLFPGNCARSVKGEEAQAPKGGGADRDRTRDPRTVKTKV